MRLKNFSKLISGLTVGAIAIVALLIYICPGTFMADTVAAASDTASLCQSDTGMAAVGAGGEAGDCVGIHLAAANIFIGSLADKTSLLLIVFFAIAIIYFGSQTELANKIRAKLTRYKYRYRLYFVSIKLQFQKKIMAWLSLLFSNDQIALLA